MVSILLRIKCFSWWMLLRLLCFMQWWIFGGKQTFVFIKILISVKPENSSRKKTKFMRCSGKWRKTNFRRRQNHFRGSELGSFDSLIGPKTDKCRITKMTFLTPPPPRRVELGPGTVLNKQRKPRVLLAKGGEKANTYVIVLHIVHNWTKWKLQKVGSIGYVSHCV